MATMSAGAGDIFDIPPDAVIRVRAEDLQRFLRHSAMGVINPHVDIAVENADDDVFCTIRWSRVDLEQAIDNAAGVRFDADSPSRTAFERLIDRTVDAIGDDLQDRSIERGWDVIGDLIPDDVIDEARALYERDKARA